MQTYNFEDWRTITVLAELNANEYMSSKICQIGSNGCLYVRPNVPAYDDLIEINVYENIFGILSDNAPSIQDLNNGRFILCKNPLNPFIYRMGAIIDKNHEGKYKIFLKNENKILHVPKQSIRLFLPPWHDG